MLRLEETSGRTYEERMADAMSAIPLLTDEWTNHNPSDPGITILENLIVFEALQGARITSIGDEARRALLKMVGFEARKGKCSRLLLTTDGLRRNTHINNNQRFYLGDMVFETRRAQDVGNCHLIGIRSFYNDKYHDHGHLLDREMVLPAKVFGDSPKVGDAIFFIADALPEPGNETSFYIRINSGYQRNPLLDRSENIFASFKWECYTKKGFQELKVKDFTGALLESGEIKLKFPQDMEYAEYSVGDLRGYCIRATLVTANYDIRPCIMQVDAFLFEVWQKDTKALAVTHQRTDHIRIQSPMKEEGYILCFGREGRGESYRRYELSANPGQRGRYCLYERKDKGEIELTFDKRLFGYEPSRVKDAVRIVIYSEEVMRQYHVGRVIGYDDQEIDLPFEHIVPDSFLLIAKRTDNTGEETFDFVRPGKKEDEALTYHLLEHDGRIVIEDAGEFIGAELYIGSIAVTEGPKGNVRAENYFLAPELSPEPIFYNPGPGTGGVFRESLEDVRNRFREDVYTPYTCITAEDYEKAAASAPGLCIRKIRAVMDELENIVHISVLPGTDEQFPKLSRQYIDTISATLSERRLITTRFQILPPVYVAVSVKLTVYVKRQFRDSRNQIEERVKKLINYIDGDKNFGDPLTFEEVFAGIENLDCVDYVYDLFMQPQNLKHAKLRDSNIYPSENCLLYPGQIMLETLITSVAVK